MRIKSISEAYSMQPVTLTVSERPITSTIPEFSIKRIEVELDETKNVYIGYNFDDKVLFKYLADSVNVHYFPE